MERQSFDIMHDNLTNVYVELENKMSSIYQEYNKIQQMKKNNNLLQGLGSVALKVISSQMDLVERYGIKLLKESLLSNLDAKATALSSTLK